ncbi:MAG: four helix bundle protein [Nitrospirae bacterium]|nr:four helix bundle protein [Nitrospirota bacterium]MBI4837683.1 four helix bundle protein [Nitrospirota bacterium]
MYWKDLEVWKKSHALVFKIYNAISSFPETERYALSNQLKRAAYSIPANIVEGHSRKSSKEFSQFLYQARGSLEELRYFLLLSKELDYLTQETFNELEKESQIVSKMLNGLLNSIKQKINS